MNNDVAAYTSSIARRFSQICDCLENLTPAQLNTRPHGASTNSPWALAVHALGNAEAWVLGIAGGRPMQRDRPAEFSSSGGDVSVFRGAVASFVAQMEVVLATLSVEELDRRSVPPPGLWGEGQPHQISGREALLRVVEHASLHLGHLQLTRDLLTQPPVDAREGAQP